MQNLPEIEPATPGLQGIGLSPTPPRLLIEEKKSSAAALLEYSEIAGSSNNEMVSIQERFVSITHLIEF